MDQSKSSNNMLAILILLLVGGGLFVYKNFFAEEVIVETATIEKEAEKTKRLLDQINRIDLDRSFLDSPLVSTLANFYVVPEQGGLGKDNPFTPVSGGGLSNVVLPLEEPGTDGGASVQSESSINGENEI